MMNLHLKSPTNNNTGISPHVQGRKASSLFDVYSPFEVEIVRAEGCHVWDSNGTRYLDLYGGHGVISVGHSHPEYVRALTTQLKNIGFYSNIIRNPLQEQLAGAIARQSGYSDHRLFLCNSGAEANENALKLASFHTSKRKVIAFRGSFHGRTSAALNVTDNPRISSPLNAGNFEVVFATLNNKDEVERALAPGDVAAVIIEGIQGIGGLAEAEPEFLRWLRGECTATGTLLILDEIQSGYGRTGSFFAHQRAGITADIVTIAKGMGNGFPVAGVLISPGITARKGMLGTTFGGNYLACAAGLAVLKILEEEDLIAHAKEVGEALDQQFHTLPYVQKVKGRGLMLGLEFDFPVKELRKRLLEECHIFTGSSSNPNLLRILPPLTITAEDMAPFIEALQSLNSNPQV